MDNMADALHHSVHLTSTFLDRSLSLNHLAQCFALQPPLLPTSPAVRHFQSKNKNNNNNKYLSEAYQNWGHAVASTIVETSVCWRKSPDK
jgi:hypothetical protein